MNRLSHPPLIIALTLALLTATGIGVSGTFVMFDDKGILSGPFSALLLISAAVSSLLILVLLDWRIWQPQRLADETEFQRWLRHDVLGCSQIANFNSSEQTAWQNIEGKFAGRRVTLDRVAFHKSAAIRWSIATDSNLNARIVRLDSPVPASAGEYNSGDADFDARYAWQTHTPQALLPLLKNDSFREAIKRTASLFAQHSHGPGIGDADAGIEIAGGKLSLLQHPAPILIQGTAPAGEILLLLQDMNNVAAALEGREIPRDKSDFLPAAESSRWLALGCAAVLFITAWLGGSWALAHWLGLPAGMLGFFTPAMLLVFVFLLTNAGKSGREAEVEDVIAEQSAQILSANLEMAQLAQLLRTDDALTPRANTPSKT